MAKERWCVVALPMPVGEPEGTVTWRRPIMATARTERKALRIREQYYNSGYANLDVLPQSEANDGAKAEALYRHLVELVEGME